MRKVSEGKEKKIILRSLVLHSYFVNSSIGIVVGVGNRVSQVYWFNGEWSNRILFHHMNNLRHIETLNIYR